MSDVKQARELVEAAGRDISALRGMSNPDVFADEIFGLHTQQAAEKLLKAWIAMLGEVYPLTHNLELLLGILQERGVSAVDHQPLVEYTPFAGRIRYEAGDTRGLSLHRDVALRRIEALYERVMLQMPPAS